LDTFLQAFFDPSRVSSAPRWETYYYNNFAEYRAALWPRILLECRESLIKERGAYRGSRPLTGSVESPKAALPASRNLVALALRDRVQDNDVLEVKCSGRTFTAVVMETVDAGASSTATAMVSEQVKQAISIGDTLTAVVEGNITSFVRQMDALCAMAQIQHRSIAQYLVSWRKDACQLPVRHVSAEYASVVKQQLATIKKLNGSQLRAVE
jgi:hypothetical protein